MRDESIGKAEESHDKSLIESGSETNEELNLSENEKQTEKDEENDVIFKGSKEDSGSDVGIPHSSITPAKHGKAAGECISA